MNDPKLVLLLSHMYGVILGSRHICAIFLDSRKRCVKSGIATFFDSAAAETSHSIQILGKMKRGSRVQTPLRDFFRLLIHENVAQKTESQHFLVRWRAKHRAASRY
jgi:hypothetical protein